MIDIFKHRSLYSGQQVYQVAQRHYFLSRLYCHYNLGVTLVSLGVTLVSLGVTLVSLEVALVSLGVTLVSLEVTLVSLGVNIVSLESLMVHSVAHSMHFSVEFHSYNALPGVNDEAM